MFTLTNANWLLLELHLNTIRFDQQFVPKTSNGLLCESSNLFTFSSKHTHKNFFNLKQFAPKHVAFSFHHFRFHSYDDEKEGSKITMTSSKMLSLVSWTGTMANTEKEYIAYKHHFFFFRMIWLPFQLSGQTFFFG